MKVQNKVERKKGRKKYRFVVFVKVKVISQQAEVAQGVPGRLRPPIFLTYNTTRVIGRQTYAPAAFTQLIFRS